MLNYNPSRTPINPIHKIDATCTPVDDPSLYCNPVGAFRYLKFTRPDIAFAVQ